ncbi:mechanosensitive ion channel family protein [Proteinivorax hydrogeniformans]|uniref:Mechanosensitive ion channel family protein n=1 Tax=Proteinivorax hydrogeniformans TaxID=1826727 RepID=A0AAU8HSV4_9FIRM
MLELISLDSVRESMPSWAILIWGVVKYPVIAMAYYFLFYFIAKIFEAYIFPYIVNITEKTNTSADTKIITAFKNPVKRIILTLGIYMAITSIPFIGENYQELLLRLYRSLVIAFIASGFYNLADTSSSFFEKIKTKFKIELDQILIPFLSKALRVVIIAISISIIAQEWGYDVNGFVAGLGIGGLAFALAAQDSLANIFGGVVIIMDKPFSIDDWIKTPSVEGVVEDITFRSTKVRTFAQALVTVPNSVLANEAVTNWTKMGRRQITFKLGVTYTTPKEKLNKCVVLIRQMLKSHPEVHPETIFVNFDGFNNSSLDIFLYFFTNTTDWGEFLAVKEDVNFKVMEILEKENVSVAFPSRSVYFENKLNYQNPKGSEGKVDENKEE